MQYSSIETHMYVPVNIILHVKSIVQSLIVHGIFLSELSSLEGLCETDVAESGSLVSSAWQMVGG